ncbi:OmpA family protein [Emticicia soli]|uniref:OmpA family protein n=1 Tax=Emticicia soli TaxID=2027878 RepID=A0ABW5J7D8_9BACT
MRSLLMLIAVSIFNICTAFATNTTVQQLDSTYTFGAFDKVSGKRLAATFKIYFNKLDPIVIQGTNQGDIQFKPATHGHYEIEISMPNYVTKRIPLNLENLGAGKTNFKELLDLVQDEYVILITDAKDKQIITTAKVKIVDAAKQEVEAKVNPKTGEWKAVLDKTKSYHISIEATGYQGTSVELEAVDANKTVKPPSKFISVSLQKTSAQLLSLTAVDAISKDPIAANYKVLRPEEETLTGQSDETNPYRIEFNPKKKYTVEVSAEGYKTITEQVTFDITPNESVKVLLKKFELQKDNYAFLFKIIDAQTKENLVSTRMRIINLANKQSIAAKIEKEGFSANLTPDTEYSIEVESEGYNQANQNINLKDLIARKQFVQEIFLIKKSADRFKFIVVDEETNKNVPGASLRVYTAKYEPVTLKPTNVQSEWEAELKLAEQYTAEIKVPGYMPYKAPLSNVVKVQQLKIKKVPTAEIYFAATDFYTKTPLVADYKLKTGTTAVTGSLNPEKTRYKVTVTPDNNYELEIASDGYQPYKDAVAFSKAANGVITVEMKKAIYTFTFNPVDSKTKAAIGNVKMSLFDNTKQAVALSNNTAKIAPQNFEKNYTLKVEVANYKSYTENIDLANIVATNFKHDVLLEKMEVAPPPAIVEQKPKEEPKLVPKQEEPPKVEEKVVAKQEEPKKEEVPVVPKPAPVVKEPEKAPVTAIVDDYFKEVAIGKHIKLENVYFDQSQPVIKPQSYPELDKLVNLLKQNPKINIEVIGHTDNVGDPRLNQYLSELRAKAVTNYLFNKGIAPSRLTHAGMGPNQPVAANDTEENRQKNRRVEFVAKEN